jgi:hypothetical protein
MTSMRACSWSRIGAKSIRPAAGPVAALIASHLVSAVRRAPGASRISPSTRVPPCGRRPRSQVSPRCAGHHPAARSRPPAAQHAASAGKAAGESADGSRRGPAETLASAQSRSRPPWLRWDLHDRGARVPDASAALHTGRWLGTVSHGLARAEQTTGVRVARDLMRPIAARTTRIRQLESVVRAAGLGVRAPAARRARLGGR